MPKVQEILSSGMMNELKQFVNRVKSLGLGSKQPRINISSRLDNLVPYNGPVNSGKKRKRRNRGKGRQGGNNQGIINKPRIIATNAIIGQPGVMVSGWASLSRNLTINSLADVGFGPGMRLTFSGLAGYLSTDGTGALILSDAGVNARTSWDLPMNPCRAKSFVSPANAICAQFERYWIREFRITYVPATAPAAGPGLLTMAVVEEDIVSPLTYAQTIGCSGSVLFNPVTSTTVVHKCKCNGPPLFMGTGGVGTALDVFQFYVSVRGYAESTLTTSVVIGQFMVDMTVDVWGISGKAATAPTFSEPFDRSFLNNHFSSELKTDDKLVQLPITSSSSSSSVSKIMPLRQSSLRQF